MPPRAPGSFRLLVMLALIGTAGCFPVAAPRFPQSVAAALAQRHMRSMESENLRLYYPEGRQEEARRFLFHVEGCATYLKRVSQVHNGVADQKLIVILPELPFNNAFVAPRLAGYDTEAVVPTFDTIDEFSLEMGQPPDPAEIACHEITHAVHFQQIAGFAWFWNALFGAVYTPQIGLDSWFDEGLAVYYETTLQPGTGRLAWPFWRGVFAAGYAGHRINGGDLHVLQRDFHAGNNYLVGSQFVRFLADRYGEDKLWKLIDVQARSIFFPLWVNVRFWQAYDKSLSTLLDEFADEVHDHMPPKMRPAGQRVVREVGYSARYARAADGSEALIASDHDSPARLSVWGSDGRLRAERNLTDVVPPRRLAIGAAVLTSGLSFSADARTLYFVSLDIDPTYQATRLYRYDVETDRLTVAHEDLRGTGGAISPDGQRYVFARADGDHHDLAVLDLATGAVRIVHAEPHRAYVAHPRFSPDGSRVVASEFDGRHFRIVVFDAASGRVLSVLPTGDGPVHDPSWVDENRILYLGTAATDAGFQVYMYDATRALTLRVSEAPYLAFEPRAANGGTVRFLNRDGWQWTVDEVSLPHPITAPPQSVAAPQPPQPVAVNGREPAATTLSPYDMSDHPYSQLDHLFTPRLYGPTLQTVGRRALSFGVVLSGNDRLSLHRWAVAGYYQATGGGAPSFLVGYTNRQLAPLTLTLSASQIEAHDVPPVPSGQMAPTNPAFTLFRRDRQVSVDGIQSIYGNPIALGFLLLETYRPADADVLVPLRRFAGPHASASFAGVERTPYTGVRRLLATSADVGAYPREWNTAGFGFVDVRGEINGVVPLPFHRRHVLGLRLRARDLLGLPADQSLLQIGGYTSALLKRSANRPEVSVTEPAQLPPGLAFVESLRGFEDYPLLTDRIFIADAAYRYPFIIDWGSASSLGLLPAFFARQIDLELFGSGATDARDGSRHMALGGALTLGLALWEIPLNFQYQVARRTTDDRGLVHLVTLGL